jgi:collagen type VI alpha
LIQGPICPHIKADIMFLLDSSGSIGGENFEKEKEFVAGYARGFDISPSYIQIGAASFATTPKNEFDLNSYTTSLALIKGIGLITFTGGVTSTGAGIDFLLSHSFTSASGDRPVIKDIAIIVTDGQSNNMEYTIAAAKKIRAQGIEVIAIGVGLGAQVQELNGIATDKQHVFQVDNFDSLHFLQAELQNATCACKYEMAYTAHHITPRAHAYVSMRWHITAHHITPHARA